MRTLSVDPGINGAGVALFDGGQLVRAEYIANRIDKSINVLSRARAMALAVVNFAAQVDCFVGEWPQVYTFGKSKGDNNDLLPLAAVLCGIVSAGHYPEVRMVRPREWKGSVDGDVMVERVKERVRAEEWSKIFLPSATSLGHNVFDGIGIGFFHLGRLERKRVFAR